MNLRLIIAATAAAVTASASAPALAGPAEDELVAIENAWSQAYMKKDAAAIDHTVAADWRGQSEKGVNTKAQMMERMKSPKERTSSSVLHDVHPRIMGDIAVVQGMEDDKGLRDGKPYAETVAWTDVFQKRAGKWVAIASQNTTQSAKK